MALRAIGLGQQRGAAAAQLDLGPAEHAIEYAGPTGLAQSRRAPGIAQRPAQRAVLIAGHRVP